MGYIPLSAATDRNKAMTVDSQTMSLSQLAKKYGLSRQRCHQIIKQYAAHHQTTVSTPSPTP